MIVTYQDSNFYFIKNVYFLKNTIMLVLRKTWDVAQQTGESVASLCATRLMIESFLIPVLPLPFYNP